MNYQQKLHQFAEGKSFVLLTTPVREPGQTPCDACGSTLARQLHVVRLRDSQRYFFVGGICLRELFKLGVISRRSRKETGWTAYKIEMQRRAQEEAFPDEAASDDLGEHPTETVGQHRLRMVTGPSVSPFIPVALLVREKDRYQVYPMGGNAFGDPSPIFSGPKTDGTGTKISPADTETLPERWDEERLRTLALWVRAAWRTAQRTRVSDKSAGEELKP